VKSGNGAITLKHNGNNNSFAYVDFMDVASAQACVDAKDVMLKDNIVGPSCTSYTAISDLLHPWCNVYLLSMQATNAPCVTCLCHPPDPAKYCRCFASLAADAWDFAYKAAISRLQFVHCLLPKGQIDLLLCMAAAEHYTQACQLRWRPGRRQVQWQG
jgi:hypothetical protein